MDIKSLYKKIYKEHGPQGWWPINNKYNKNKFSEKTEEERFEIAVGAILTQNTSWKNVEKALNKLRGNEALNRETIKNISQKALSKLIISSGYHNQKARKLKEFAEFDKEVTRENILNIWGIGQETADSILLYAYNQPVFVIDTYTKRVLLHYGIGKSEWNYEQLQNLFHDNLEKDYRLFNEFHALIVEHAKQLKNNKT
ncbi:endonuclease III domain-containing protein [Candidatus Woesearchaeota archaeon]|jgi:endonuclease-3 related protein|nr:endonuclease III domain-containing protein [Candidatus Woesearchaeota archaeon]